MIKKTILLLLLFFFFLEPGCPVPSPLHWIMQKTGDLLLDTAWLQYYFLSLNTVKVLTGALPIYLITRMADPPIHRCFYDSESHANVNQMPSHCSRVINKVGDVGIIGLSSLAFFAQDAKLATTARIFGIGAVCGLILKDAVKECPCDANLRPWNAAFSRHKRAHGGFPSGHMFEAAYMATVWGWQYGASAAIPLTVFAAASFGTLINCNRHYTSQVVAGAALGIAYGIAANMLIAKKLSDSYAISCSFEQNCCMLRATYHF